MLNDDDGDVDADDDDVDDDHYDDDDPDKIPTHHLGFYPLGFCLLGFIPHTIINLQLKFDFEVILWLKLVQALIEADFGWREHGSWMAGWDFPLLPPPSPPNTD